MLVDYGKKIYMRVGAFDLMSKWAINATEFSQHGFHIGYDRSSIWLKLGI